MSVTYRTVEADDDGQRLDRWFKKAFPTLGYGVLQKLMRTGQVRVDGKRCSASTNRAPSPHAGSRMTASGKSASAIPRNTCSANSDVSIAAGTSGGA